ncbi:MAG: beta strand repeat-containing protein, partial [Planctomycetia bacterium]
MTLYYDTTIISGSTAISLGSVAAPPSSAQVLTLGDANQTGPVNITGNVNLPVGYVNTESGAFDVSLEGATNSIGALQVLNRGALRIGQAGGTSRISDGLVATAPPAVSLAGVIETVNNALRLGNVTLRADTTLRSGSGEIQTGTVTDGAEAFTLSLGSVDQTGGITLGGSVTVDDLVTAAGTFSVSLLGGQNDLAQQVTFANTFYVAFGDDTNEVSRFVGGVTATSQTASNFLIGTVRTAGGAIDIRGGYLAGLTTLDTSDGGAIAGGAPITLRSGATLESHVLTTIGGVGESAQGTYLLGTGAFGSGTTNTGALEVLAGSLFIGDGATSVATLTVANDTRIRVAAGSLAVGAGSTIDASGRSLTLQADDIAIASAPGSIDAAQVAIAPVTAGRNVFLATAGTGLVLSTAAIQAIDADALTVGEAGYAGRVTLGALTLADTTLAIVADGTGGSVAINGAFTSTGTPASGVALQITGSGATTVLDADITSSGDVLIDDAVELAAARVTITTSGGGDVTITGGTKGIWSTKGEANSLVVTAGAGGVSLATRAGFGDQGGTADLVRDLTLTGGSVLLGTGNVIAGNLSIGAPQVTLAAVVRAAGTIGIDNGAGEDAAVVIAGNTILDATQEGKIPAGNPVTVRGTVTANAANDYLFELKAGTSGDVLVTGRIGAVGAGVALGQVMITGNDLTVAAIDG